MQLKRSYLRRVNVLKPFINENCPSSRRAYISIRLAVKTSRPQCFIILAKIMLQIYNIFYIKSPNPLFLILVDNRQIK